MVRGKRKKNEKETQTGCQWSWQLEKAGNEKQIEKPVVKYGKVASQRIPRMFAFLIK